MKNNRINDAVKNLHRDLWLTHAEGARDSSTLISLLEPSIAAKMLGFELKYVSFIKPDTAGYRPAGFLDRDNNEILISTQFSLAEQRFTAAHELGHAILHKNQSLFRDRPTSWQKQDLASRPLIEFEADNFGAKYLMPPKLIRLQFESRFHVKTPYTFDDTWAFHLSPQDPDSLLTDGDVELERGFALAKARTFNRNHFVPLHKQFGVSPSAMAYRLIELNLVGSPLPLPQAELATHEGPHEPLFSPGLHIIDEQNLEELFAFPFSPSHHRDQLIKKLRKFLALIKAVGAPCSIWIDGSFTTEKIEPRDIDLVVFMHKHDIQSLSRQQRIELDFLKDRELLKTQYACDVYIACADDADRKDYFMSKFGKDDRHGIEKGIPVLQIGGQLKH